MPVAASFAPPTGLHGAVFTALQASAPAVAAVQLMTVQQAKRSPAASSQSSEEATTSTTMHQLSRARHCSP
ncbi:hypothetical protein OEZ85_004277 [Tetradesmus obliquus]|uniref:Secreted protein n=1 Tax=Tetradesmus obliquus TaxID=3088 RepID=A0ABY8UK56_TETOB|nr:hypothetical protein OEZ85_004277 [Tetradesmus obliquus]